MLLYTNRYYLIYIICPCHDQRNVFIIDFGSVSVEGDVPSMTCQQYCPPDSVVTLAWDVFSLGVVFSEMPRLPRKEQSAAAATQDEGGCHQVPSATPVTQSAAASPATKPAQARQPVP